jgi:hypothetical protein
MLGEFVATRFEGSVPIEVGASRSVRWAGGQASPEQRPPVVQALASLVLELERDGWERVGHGEDWYAYRFRRRVGTHGGADRVEPAVADHQLREADPYVSEPVVEPVRVELELVEPKPLEPALLEPVESIFDPDGVAKQDMLEQSDRVEPTPTRFEAGAQGGADPGARGPSPVREAEPEPESDEPWFAVPRRSRELGAQVSEVARTVLVHRISAYSFDN